MDQGSCRWEDCSAAPLPQTARCWAHAEEWEVSEALAVLKQTRRLDARGVNITGALLQSFLAAVVNEHGDKPEFEVVQCEGAQFLCPASFSGTTFAGPVDLTGANFADGADFEDCTFHKGALFDRAVFSGGLSFVESRVTGGSLTFTRAKVSGPAYLMRAQWTGTADFTDASFRSRVRFDTGASFASLTLAGALFAGAVEFDESHCIGRADFRGTVFSGPASFRESGFSSGCDFARASFASRAAFTNASFGGLTRFDDVVFADAATFWGATFRDSTDRVSARGEGGFSGVSFDRTRFLGETWFRGTRFDSLAIAGAVFAGAADFAGVHARYDADLTDTTFTDVTQFGPLLVGGRLVLDGAVYQRRTHIDVAASFLQARRARFPAGVRLRVRFADVDLGDADLSAPCTLSGVGPWDELDEDLLVTRKGRNANVRPRLLSVRGADVAGLVLSDMDLRACEFSDANNLDRVRLGNSEFARTPELRRWSSRQALAEEHHWRASRLVGNERFGWDPPFTRQQVDVTPGQVLPAAEIAEIYRSLRKGREDARDEPGAADFYYGEMEMRRNAQRDAFAWNRRQGRPGAAAAANTERLILLAYWASSGYGLRAWRALSLLVAVIVAAGILFGLVGFAPVAPEQQFEAAGVTASGGLRYEVASREAPRGLHRVDDGVLFAAQATTALLRGPERPLEPMGEWLHLGLRLVGPVLIGFAALALRNRTRR